MLDWTIESLSTISTRLELYCNGVCFSYASALNWVKASKLYLISNWHVYSGLNYQTGQSPLMDAPIPDRVKFRLAHKRGDRIYWKQYERELIVDGKNVWLQHPQRGQDFDIAALEIQDVDLESVIWISKDAVWDPIKMRASADVFIVGYPEKTPSQENLPIWKRGTIASEPQHWSKNLPIILVDTLGRPGLSGSPVYIRTAGVYEEERSGDLTAGDPTATRFVGIYSGRFGVSQTEDFQLGCVWYDYLIDEVVSGNSIGKSTQRTFEEFMSHSSEKAPKPNYEK